MYWKSKYFIALFTDKTEKDRQDSNKNYFHLQYIPQISHAENYMKFHVPIFY